MTSVEALVTAVTILADTFRQQISVAAMQGYSLALEELSPEEIHEATRRALRECRFMPTPSEVLALAGKGGPRQVVAEMALAWEAVRQARRVHSWTTGVDFGPLVNAVVRNLGGWLEFCGKPDSSMVWERKRFEEIFLAFSDKPPGTLHGEPLDGEFGGVVRVAIGGASNHRRELPGVGEGHLPRRARSFLELGPLAAVRRPPR